MRKTILSSLLFSAVFSFACIKSHAVDAPKPNEVEFPDELNVPLNKGKNANDTYNKSMKDWESELRKTEKDNNRRSTKARTRGLALTYKMLEWYKKDQKEYFFSLSKYASLWVSLEQVDRGCEPIKEYIGKNISKTEDAIEALSFMLDLCSWDNPWKTKGSYKWLDYASQRIMALKNVGVIPDSHPVVIKAMKCQATLYGQYTFNLSEADKVITELSGMTEEALWAKKKYADILRAICRPQKALEIYSSISEETNVIRDMQDTEREIRNEDAKFPSDLGVEGLLQPIRTTQPNFVIHMIDSAMKTLADKDHLSASGESQYSSAWTSIARHLVSMSQAEMEIVRKNNESNAASGLSAATSDGSVYAITKVFRQYPFSASVHKAMLETAEREMKKGNFGAAYRLFSDINSYSDNPSLKKQAKIGELLCIGNMGLTDTFKDAFEGITGNDKFKLMNKELDGRALIAAIKDIDSEKHKKPATNTSKQISQLEYPERQPWPDYITNEIPLSIISRINNLQGDMQEYDGMAYLTGPQIIAAYQLGQPKPVWFRTNDSANMPFKLDPEDPVTIPGKFRPAIDGGVLFTRWGIAPNGMGMNSIAAFDAKTGRMLWDSSNNIMQETLTVTSDPAVDQQSVYFIAAENFSSFSSIRLFLVALDRSNGKLQWKRQLAESSTLRLSSIKLDSRRSTYINLTTFGGSVSARAGSVYCSTALGSILCCDSRDGMIEWAYEYERLNNTRNINEVYNREGIPAQYYGQNVVISPRDYQGVLAMDIKTGHVAWDKPLINPNAFICATQKALVCHGLNAITAISPEDGSTLWSRRLSREIRSAYRAPDGCIAISTTEGYYLFDENSGKELSFTAWGKTQPLIYPIIADKDKVAVVTSCATGSSAGDMIKGKPSGTGLPMTQLWSLSRGKTEVWAPSPESGIDNRFIAYSEGIIEGFSIDANVKSLWSRPIRSGMIGKVWRNGSIIIVYPEKTICISLDNGAIKWSLDTGDQMSSAYINNKDTLILSTTSFPPFRQVYLEGDSRGTVFTSVDMNNGSIAWSTNPSLIPSNSAWGNAEVSGERFYLLGYSYSWKKQIKVEIEVKTGKLEAEEVGQKQKKKTGLFRKICTAGDKLVFIDSERKIRYIPLSGDGDGKEFALPTKNYAKHRWDDTNAYVLESASNDKWVYFRIYNRYRGDDRFGPFIINVDDPKFYMAVSNCLKASFSGDEIDLYRTQAMERITTGDKNKFSSITIPPDSKGTQVVVFHNVTDNDTTTLFSIVKRRSESTKGNLRIDTINNKSGKRTRSQLFENIVIDEESAKANEAAFIYRNGYLIAPSISGLACYARQAGADKSGSGDNTAFKTNSEIIVDGDLSDWADSVENHGKLSDRLLLAHDNTNLFIGFSRRDSSAITWNGGDSGSGGDWLELGFAGSDKRYRFGIGVDNAGKTYWKQLGANALPERVQGQARFSADSGMLTYEASIPIKNLTGKNGTQWQDVGFYARLWDEKNGEPYPVMTWGAPVFIDDLPQEAYHKLSFVNMTLKSRNAKLEFVKSNPESLGSWKLIKSEISRDKGNNLEKAIDLFRMILASSPNGSRTNQILTMLHKAYLNCGVQDPVENVVAIAKEYKVDNSIIDVYRKQAGAYISQWIYLDKDNTPDAVEIIFHDGQTWEHRALFGNGNDYGYGTINTDSLRFIGGLPEPGKWAELKIPLIDIGMEEKAITGITFQNNIGLVHWDQTSVVTADGKSTTFIDEKEDINQNSKDARRWKWDSKLVKSKKVSHYSDLAKNRWQASTHGIYPLSRPISEHITVPTSGAYVSAWVFIDPQKPAKGIAIGIKNRDESDWRDISWGQSIHGSRSTGELPSPGKWTEIRLPLIWTDSVGSIIEGMRFQSQGGNSYWDKVEVVSSSNRETIFEDENPGKSVQGKWNWTDKNKKSGAKSLLLDTGSSTMASVLPMEKLIVPGSAKIIALDYNSTFIRDWLVLAPFDNPKLDAFEVNPPESDGVKPDKTYKGKDGAEIKWTEMKSESGMLDFAATIKPTENVTAYAACWVYSDKETAAIIEAGSDDTLQIWLNGQLVHANHIYRGVRIAEDTVPVTLAKGWNEVMAKVEQGNGGWGLAMGIRDAATGMFMTKVTNKPPKK
ncbi:MAG: PQQ-binding-like beta-propeller repeat protein [Planctomycetes bacterium]|nr:PQQ-binding-like beta-propeller repeat protein [Planctomycetota bacterium]